MNTCAYNRFSDISIMSDPVNLTDLKPEEFKQFLNSFDHVFSDCDGVLWEPATALPGSGEFVKLMEKHGKTVHFVSNNSLRSRENYENKFRSAGIENGFERLTIPSVAIAEYLKSIDFKKAIYCVACPETIRVFESYGFKCKYGPEEVPELSIVYVKFLEDDEEIGAVVFDSDIKVNMPKLYKSITYLKRDDVHFIAGATDKKLPMAPGKVTLGLGVMTDIVADESNRVPLLIGKPGQLFGKFAMKRAEVIDPSRVLFIGDMIEQDIGVSRATGFKTLLVLTSHSKEEMLASQTLRPDYYAENLASIVPFLS